jgi:L-iditol 2-dehydrogenase
VEYNGKKFTCDEPGLFSISSYTWRNQHDATILKILSVGICSSDYSRFFRGTAYAYPLTPGHEIYARVENPGSESKLKQGDLVSVFPLLPCQKCSYCNSNEFQLCEKYSYYGSREDGGLASYMNVNDWNIKKHHFSTSNRLGNQIEPLSVVQHAFNRFDTPSEIRSLAILGGGFLTYLAIFVAKSLGITKIQVISSSDERRKFFSSFVEVANPNQPTTQKFDAAIDFSGNSRNFDSTVNLLAKRSQVVLAANSRSDTGISSYAWDKLIRGELRIKGTWNSTYLGPDEKDDWSESILLLGSKSIPDLFPHHEVNLTELPKYLRNQKISRKSSLTDKMSPRLSINIDEN